MSKRCAELEYHGFNGVMYPYGIFQNDHFIRIARYMDKNSHFKYIVAIRPYVISAQYLSMICSSLNEISKNRIEINLLTGWIYENEKRFGGILSEINDSSPSIDRSKYMMRYAKEFKRISDIDFYISTTNDITFEESSFNNYPMIIPYCWYKVNRFNITDQKYLISIAPIIRDGEVGEIPNYQDVEVFTKKEFFRFLDNCKNRGVSGILFQEVLGDTEYKKIIACIKEYS